MIVFVFAMEKEATPFLKEVSIKKRYNAGYTQILECDYRGKPFVVGISGVGKGFAAASVAAIAARYDVDFIINFGVAGTLDGNIAPILSAVIGEDYVEYDLDTSAVGDPVGMVSGINIVELPSSPMVRQILEKACEKRSISSSLGRIASGDTFFPHDSPRKAEVIEKWHPLCIDMESAPYAQIAYAYEIPFAAVRLISDWLDPSREYFENTAACSERIKEIALQVLLS